MEVGPLAAEVPAGDSAPADGAAGAAGVSDADKENDVESPPPPPPAAKARRVERHQTACSEGCGKVFVNQGSRVKHEAKCGGSAQASRGPAPAPARATRIPRVPRVETSDATRGAFASVAFTPLIAGVPPGTLTLSNMSLALQALAAGRRAAESFLIEDLTDAEIDRFGKREMEELMAKVMLPKTGNKAQLQDNLRRCRDAVKKLKAEADATRAAASRAASGGGGAAGTSGGGGGADGGGAGGGGEGGGGGGGDRAGDDADGPGPVNGSTRARGVGNVPVRGVLQPIDANVQPPSVRFSALTSAHSLNEPSPPPQDGNGDAPRDGARAAVVDFRGRSATPRTPVSTPSRTPARTPSTTTPSTGTATPASTPSSILRGKPGALQDEDEKKAIRLEQQRNRSGGGELASRRRRRTRHPMTASSCPRPRREIRWARTARLGRRKRRETRSASWSSTAVRNPARRRFPAEDRVPHSPRRARATTAGRRQSTVPARLARRVRATRRVSQRVPPRSSTTSSC